jgi:effector-binding domain-containing protein
MDTEPRVEQRAAQPYIGVARTVTMTSIAEIADQLPALFGWVEARDMAPADAPFLRYVRFAPDGELEMEAGLPVAAIPSDGLDGEVYAAELPAGRYAMVTHVGHPDGLEQATGDLLRWAADEGLRFDRRETEDGEVWGCRLERYRSDPAAEPDMNAWETDVLVRLAD